MTIKAILTETVETIRAFKNAANAVAGWAQAAHANEIRKAPDLYGPRGTEIRLEPIGIINDPTLQWHGRNGGCGGGIYPTVVTCETWPATTKSAAGS